MAEKPEKSSHVAGDSFSTYVGTITGQSHIAGRDYIPEDVAIEQLPSAVSKILELMDHGAFAQIRPMDRILAVLIAFGPQPVGELLRRTHLPLSDFVRIYPALAEAELIHVSGSEGDEILSITQRGQTVLM